MQSLKRLHEAAKSKCETRSNSGSSELKYLVMLLSTRSTLTWELNYLSTASRFALSQVQISYRSYKTVMFPHRRLYGQNFVSFFQRYMYFSVHLMWFLDQTISDPSWYYAEGHVVLLFLCKCGQSWFTGSLCCLLSRDSKTTELAETGNGLWESLTYRNVSFTRYIFQETYLFKPMQMNFQKTSKSNCFSRRKKMIRITVTRHNKITLFIRLTVLGAY